MAWASILKGIGKFGLGALGIGGGADNNKIASSVAQILGATGAGIGAASQASASNRGEQFGGQAILEQLMQQRDRDQFSQGLQREQEGRASGTDAWRKLMASQRTLSPGARPQLSPYSVAPRQATDMERQGASAMSEEVMKRLQGGNQMPVSAPRPMQIDPGLLKAGGMEKAGGWLSPILSFLGRPQAPVSTGYR